MKNKITPGKLRQMKEDDEKIAMLTAYDSPTAKIVEEAGIEIILVGDSVGNTVLGYDNTLPVTLDEIIHHTKAVDRGIENPLLVGDMPFLSYQVSAEEAVKNAGKLVKEGNADAIKLEGGSECQEQIEKMIDAGIPVMGHLGLTPQRILQFGGFQPRGKRAEEARRIFEDAKKLEEWGIFCLILESVPKQLGKKITEELDIPTIGIGAGPHCDGQVLVFHDLLGLSDFTPSFVKEYADIKSSIKEAIGDFKKEVKSGDFPTPKHSYEMEKEELEKLDDF